MVGRSLVDLHHEALTRQHPGFRASPLTNLQFLRHCMANASCLHQLYMTVFTISIRLG